jgi:hypothetical protein
MQAVLAAIYGADSIWRTVTPLLISGVHHETDERIGFFFDRLPREIETGERTPSPTVKGLKLAP